MKKEFCNANGLLAKTFESSIKEFKELQYLIGSKEKLIDPEYKSLLAKNDKMSKEKHEIKVQKCFFSTFFDNLSMLLS